MKKLFTLGLCLIFITGYSQRVSVGISAGAGKTSINNSYGYTGTIAYRAGVFTDIKIINPLLVKAEIGYDSYANQSDQTYTNSVGVTIDGGKNINRWSVVEIPVGVKLVTGIKVHPYYSLMAGPSLLLTAKNHTRGVENIPNSTTGTTVDIKDDYNSIYWSIYNAAGIELKGEKITPFFEFRWKHSVSDFYDNPYSKPLNVFSLNIGIKF